MKAIFIILFLSFSFSIYPFYQTRGATETTKEINAKLLQEAFFQNNQAFNDAKKNYIASLSEEIMNIQSSETFFEEESKAPYTINPKLYKKSQLAKISGLFKVVDRIYQIRGSDFANMSIIEGESGIIVIDPLISREIAKASLDLYYKHRSFKPIIAIIYSQKQKDPSDIIAEDLSSEAVKVITADNFIDKTDYEMQIDGLTFQFLVAPNAKTPSEIHCYIPDLQALFTSENICYRSHAAKQCRASPLVWSEYFQEVFASLSEKAKVLYGMHQWPIWGEENVKEHLMKQSDLYKFINDETLKLASHGYSLEEVAEKLILPQNLAEYWSDRYDSLKHDVKETYSYYFGWFDGNAAHLHKLPPLEASKKYVKFMGGAKTVFRKAKKAYNKGEYRFVAEIMDHLVSAYPNFREARELQADTLEQLGFQTDSSLWRNYYLSEAKDLRDRTSLE